MTASRDEGVARLEAEVHRLRERVRQLEQERLVPDRLAQSIAESSADNIMLLGRDLKIRYINWTLPEFAREEVVGTPLARFLPVESKRVAERCFERVVRTKASDRYETTFVSGSGEVSHWEARVTPILQDGEVAGFALISSNVSERRAAAADRDRFFDLSVDILAVAGMDGYFKRINPAFERILGYDAEELLARPLLEFVHPDDHEEAFAAGARLAAGEVALDFENRYRHKDGSYRAISWRAMPDPARRIVYAVGRDVTAQRELEAQLRHSQKMEAIGRLAGGLAHDFNNLLMTISANAQFAADCKGDRDRQEDHLQAIVAGTSRAAELTRQLLSFGQRQPLRRTAVEVRQVLDDLVRLVRRVIPESIEMCLDVADALPAIRADQAQIEQVLLNLTLNARDAMPGGGQLFIRAETVVADERFRHKRPWATRDAFVKIAVRDTGSGMSRDVRDRVFEPFFTTKELGRGSGLGLAMAYAIAQAHDGNLSVVSEPGHGATFELFLPAAEGPSVAPEARSTTVASEPARGETILVAEDERPVLDAVVKVLSDAGYAVLTALDGQEAQRVFGAHPDCVALVLLDVVMPKASGAEALRAIRALRPDVPAIFMSGYPGSAAELDGLETPVVSKPFAPEELLLFVRSALDGALEVETA